MVANFFPIITDFEFFQVQRIPYSKELLQELRRKYKDTHSFFTHSDFIYLCPFFESSDIVGDLVSCKANEDPVVFGLLFKHIIFRTLKTNFPDLAVTSFYPLRFKSRNPKHDFASDLLPNYLKGVIAYKKETELQLRQVFLNGNRTWGVTINNEYRWEFNINANSLFQEGFDIIGLEALVRTQKMLESGDYVDRFVLIGQVERVYNGIAVLATNKGKQEEKLEHIRLHKTPTLITKYLEFKIGNEKTRILVNGIATKEISRYDSKHNLTDLTSTARLLASLNYQNADGFAFKISPNPASEFQTTTQQSPTFVYSYDGYQTDPRPDAGLNRFGPYDSFNFPNKKPRILVICHRLNRGIFTTFVAKFKNGIQNSTWYKAGFIAKYRLQDVEFIVEELNDYSVASYEETIRQVMRKNADSSISMALIETKSEWKSFSISKNPYYQVYSYLLSLGIPVQWITNENARKPDQFLENILNSIALQIYAKIGGTPWVLPASPNIERELVIGIGSSVIKSNSYKDAYQHKIIGITTFFSSDGRYLFGNKSRDVSYDQYFDELLYNIDSSLKEISKRDGWRDGETVRIVFHIFKSLKNQEVKVVEALVLRFSQYNIKFAFVTVSDDHPFWLFDPQERGVLSGSNVKGQFVPRRGNTVVINDYSCLIQMKGAQQLKTVKQGVSRPLLVSIHKESTFNDLFYIAQQIFSFSNLSWRSFLPIQEPVTIYYSDLIANKLAHLRQVNGWKSEIINGPLKFSKWFL